MGRERSGISSTLTGESLSLSVGRRRFRCCLLETEECRSRQFQRILIVTASVHGQILQFIMDYSSLPNDPDHPAGADPWQSSPQPDSVREPDSPSGKHAPSTPEPQQQEERDGSDQESPSASNYGEDPPKTNGTGSIPSRSNTASDIRFQGPPLTEEELRQQQLYQQRQHERYQQALHAQQHSRGPGPQRYHSGARAGQRQPPQYKLQAKITGLERTGKKDPAITFDVHVSL